MGAANRLGESSTRLALTKCEAISGHQLKLEVAMTIYIGLDGHIYIRLYGHLMWRSAERCPQELIDIA